MLNIDWNIEFATDDKKYRLALLSEVEIVSSVNNLVDTATITLPESVMNEPLHLENKIKRGSEVIIEFGYNNDIVPEFSGFVKEVINTDGSLKVFCEDALFLFRKSVADKQLKNTNIKSVATYIVSQIDATYKVQCDYGITYEKFTIHQATGYDVLKKIQQETKANIWFDTAKKVLHIHPAYVEKTGEAKYSMQQNIENSSLEFKTRINEKYEVIIESTGLNGRVTKVKAGTTGGSHFMMKVGAMSKESLQRLADNVLKKRNTPKYEGSFDTWLTPICRPGYSVKIMDEDYPDNAAWYYIESVTSKISSSGGVRSISPGIKLRGNG